MAQKRDCGERRTWVRPYLRACRAIEASIRLIRWSVRTAVASERCADRRPIQASRQLWAVSNRLVRASVRMVKAAREIDEAKECIVRQPNGGEGMLEVVLVTASWAEVQDRLLQMVDGVATLHCDVLDGLESGDLVPEPAPSHRRPRIVLAPRPVPIRAFLFRRQHRVTDRIAPLLGRRRRTPRPAALRVPRRSVLGRAPPLSSLCAL